MSITADQLRQINARFPNDKAYRIMAGMNLTLPQFISGNRGNMYTTHQEHAIHPIHAETPNMPTGFEKSYGKYTDSYKVADADYMVIAVICKYQMTGRFKYIYVVQHTVTKVYDVIEVSHYECLSESNGYLRPYTKADDYVAGQIIKKGTTIYRSDSHDEYGNYRSGINPNVVFISLPENEEDGIVYRQGYYEQGSFYNFEKIPLTLNKNQILLNTYGDDFNYKCFPNIGEQIKDGILYSKRTIDYGNAAGELTDASLRTITSSDESCAGHGYVADIDVWINDREEFEDSSNKQQIYFYYCELVKYYTQIHNILDPIVNASKKSNVQYTHRLRFTYEHARNYLDTNVKWLNNNNSFEFAYIVFTTYVKKNIFNGFKITDRFGGKGVISKVWPDEYMPRDKYGRVADIILSPPGTTARANPGQNYEQEYNFCAAVIEDRIAALPTIPEKEALLVDFIMCVNEKEGQALKVFLSSKTLEQKVGFFNDIKEHGIYLVEEPFGGTISIANLEILYTRYGISPGPVTLKREFIDTLTALPLENEQEVKLRDVHIGDATASFIMPEGVPTLASLVTNTKDGKKADEVGVEGVGITPFDIDTKEKDPYVGYTQPVSFVPGVGYMRYNVQNSDIVQDDTVKAYINDEGHLVRQYISENAVVIGKKHYLILKQTPDEKFSVRSLDSTNQVGTPNKPGKQGNLMSPYSKSAIRNGEMESDNLFTRIDNEIVHRYIATHSTNPEMRDKLDTMLLTEDPLQLHDLPIKSEDIKDDAPALMFHATLFSVGISVVPIYAPKGVVKKTISKKKGQK